MRRTLLRVLLLVLPVAAFTTRATTLHTVATPSSAPCTLYARSTGGATSTTLLHPYLVQPAQYCVRFRAMCPAENYTVSCPGVRARTFVREEREARERTPQLWPVRIGQNGQYFVAGPANKSMLPIGLNIAWPTAPPATSALAFYTEIFDALSAAGGNFARVWLGPCLNSSFSFNELQILKTGARRGDGALVKAPWIDLDAAAALDSILDAAARAGVRVVLVLDSFNSLCPHAVSALCRYEASVWAPLLENRVRCASYFTSVR